MGSNVENILHGTEYTEPPKSRVESLFVELKELKMKVDEHETALTAMKKEVDKQSSMQKENRTHES